MNSYTEIADNLRTQIRPDWCDKIAAADALVDAARNFVEKVERGQAHSVHSYNEFKVALQGVEQ